MKDHNDYLPGTLQIIELDVDSLRTYGDSDAELNYLYFLRDEVNRRIKKANQARKVA